MQRTSIERSKRASPGCRSAARAIRYYKTQTHAWQEKRGSELAERIRWPNCRRAVAAAKEWQARARAARKSYERWWAGRGQIIALLERGLSGTPMAGTGKSLEKHGRRNGVSPFFMAAVAATESSLGAAACGSGGYNAWGLGNCGSAWSVPAFGSWDEAISYYARYLTKWKGHTSPYSFVGYAACDACWARTVSSWMHSLFGVSARTRYP